MVSTVQRLAEEFIIEEKNCCELGRFAFLGRFSCRDAAILSRCRLRRKSICQMSDEVLTLQTGRVNPPTLGTAKITINSSLSLIREHYRHKTHGKNKSRKIPSLGQLIINLITDLMNNISVDRNHVAPMSRISACVWT